MNNDQFPNLKRLFDKLVGTLCWGVSAGGCTGSRFILNLGDKIKRSVALRNSSLPELQRNYEAELGLIVECAAWRLDKGTKVITSSTDDSSPEGPMVRGLSLLIGKKVMIARVTPPGMDSIIEFEDGLRLQIFCDQFGLDNYTIAYREFYVSVGSRSKIMVEGTSL